MLLKLKSLEINGFKSFAKKGELVFNNPITAIVGPNGSGKSNVAESFRFVLGEQSIKSMRGKKGEDLIFNGGKDSPRANRASVKLVFDNSPSGKGDEFGDRMFNIDFDEVMIERIVHRDGVNEYSINGSQVRLRDVAELLAHANIGASGHHIISQGEADRLLSAQPKERKEMIEEALGLKVYQYKKDESEKKLGKTGEHIKEIEIMRREIAPHLKYLKKQVEKIEKAEQLRTELTDQYRIYFSHESTYLKDEKTRIHAFRESPTEELKKLEHDLAGYRKSLKAAEDEAGTGGGKTNQLLTIERSLRDVRGQKDQLMREIGRLEGEVSFIGKTIERKKREATESNTKQIYFREVEDAFGRVNRTLSDLTQSDDFSYVKKGLADIRETLESFIHTHGSAHAEVDVHEEQAETARVSEKIKSLETQLTTLAEKEGSLDREYAAIRAEIELEKDKNVEAEKAILTIMSRQNELHGMLGRLKAEEERLAIEQADFEKELQEAVALVGRGALVDQTITQRDSSVHHDAAGHRIEHPETEPRTVQTDRRRQIEKIKIRLEETGGAGGDDIMREHKETEERDLFLMKELEDLMKSSEDLHDLIADLTSKLSELFKEGIQKINREFDVFFKLMFGGGTANLELIKEEKRKRKKSGSIADDDFDSIAASGYGNEYDGDGMADDDADENGSVEIQEGIEIQVSLPHKRTKGLIMLSGGERALTSIALLFAMSQVNPPPFIILDETDAALDEANSRRYGDMIESLSKHSQLILITHNRETMSRAGIIYGVTMGKDGASKLLSIAFDDALAVAK
jgi:chromosome segregation ATPase